MNIFITLIIAIVLLTEVDAYIKEQSSDSKDKLKTEIVTQCIAAYMADPVNIPPICKEYLK